MLRRILAAWVALVAALWAPAAGAAERAMPRCGPGVLRLTGTAAPEQRKTDELAPGSEVVVLVANPVFLADRAAAKDAGTPWYVTFLLLLGVAVVAAGGGSSLGQPWARRRWERRNGPLSDVLDEPDDREPPEGQG